jgi:3-oxoacyl-[acyl-carrier protein] reductase
MELGLNGRRAIVCASSRGLGKACARALAREGCEVVINGRDADALNEAAAEIRDATGRTVQTVRADITTEKGRSLLLAACPQTDILVNNNAGPPPGRFLDWAHADWIAAIEANMLAPIFMIKAVLPGMRERKFGRIVNITSAMVKAPRGHQGLSTAARTGLTALCKAVSRDVAADNVTINNLLPERFDTGRLQELVERSARTDGLTIEQARQKILATVAAKRFGRPDEFGDACAFLCSAQAGFMSGQNLQLDGGSYPGLI